MSLGNSPASIKTRFHRHYRLAAGRAAVVRGAVATLPRWHAESLESRVLLSTAASAVDLFNTSSPVLVENQGQWADQGVRYAFDGSGCAIAFRDEGLDFRLTQEPSETTAGAIDDTDGAMTSPQAPVQNTTFLLRFDGANRIRPAGEDRAETVFNYFVGEPSTWRSNVAAYETLAYTNLYPGIDLRMSGQRSSMKYEFHVAPGSNYQQIQLRYDGIRGLSLGEGGSLLVDLGDGWGQWLDDAPVIYQEVAGQRVEVAGRFVLLAPTSYGFELTGTWDPQRELVIDPNLSWSTYLGGRAGENGFGIAVDTADNVLVTGISGSSGWISGGYDTTPNGGTLDAFVVKLSPSGGLLWSTYLGGNGDDYGLDIAADGSGNVLIKGRTDSSGWISGGFDTVSGAGGFVAKLSPAGQHVWSTYVSPGDNSTSVAVDDSDNVLVAACGIGVDASGNALVAGTYARSYEYISAFDVVKISPNGEQLWSTHLSGSGDGTNFSAFGLNGFVAKINPDGQQLWTTLFGGDDDERIENIAVDAFGNAMVVGCTNSIEWISGGFDTSYNGWPWDGFVAKFSPDGQQLWSTYLGGGNEDVAEDVAVDSSGNAWVAGSTNSPQWVSGGFDTSANAGAFVAKISPAGQHIWSTYMGSAWQGHSITVVGVGLDATPPKVLSFATNNSTGQRSPVTQISVTFSQDIGDSLQSGDLVLQNLTTHRDIAVSAMSVAYDASTKTGTWIFPSLLGSALPVGDYLAVIVASETTNAFGIPLDGNGDGVGGDDFSANFSSILSAIEGSDDDDLIYIQGDAAENTIRIWCNQATTEEPTYTWDTSWPESLRINGAGGDDTLILDFMDGDALPTGGFVYNGGDGADSLVICGTHSSDNLAINASQVVFQDSTASYASVESIELAANPGANAVLASLELSGSARIGLTGTGRVALVTQRLSILDDGTLDLGPNDLIVHATPQTRDGVFAAVLSLVKAAHSHWIGTGITSHAAAANALMGLGVILNDHGGADGPVLSEFNGEQVGVNDILVKYTLHGDVNLDGEIDGSDYAVTDLAYWLATPNPGWRNGDCNYDGVVDGSDYAIMDLAYWLQKSDTPLGGSLDAPSLSEAAGPEAVRQDDVGIDLQAPAAKREEDASFLTDDIAVLA